MIKQYGKDAGIHCMYAIMNNYDNEAGLAYWKAVDIEIAKEWKNERRKTDQKN